MCVPETFDPDIIQCPVPTVHTDCDFLLFKIFNPCRTGEFRALVRVYNIRFAMIGDCFTKHFLAVFRIQRVGYIPANNIPAIYVNDGRQIKESFFHRDVRYINAPYMVRMSNFQTTKLVRMDVFCQPSFTQVPLRIDGHDAHFTKQSPNTLWSNENAKITQEIHHPQNAFCGMLQAFFVHHAHQLKVCRILLYRLVIKHDTIQSK